MKQTAAVLGISTKSLCSRLRELANGTDQGEISDGSVVAG